MQYNNMMIVYLFIRGCVLAFGVCLSCYTHTLWHADCFSSGTFLPAPRYCSKLPTINAIDLSHSFWLVQAKQACHSRSTNWVVGWCVFGMSAWLWLWLCVSVKYDIGVSMYTHGTEVWVTFICVAVQSMPWIELVSHFALLRQVELCWISVTCWLLGCLMWSLTVLVTLCKDQSACWHQSASFVELV